MHVQSFRVKNFRRLRDVTVDLDAKTTIFVGANNSGKTSATQVFQLFLGESKGSFSIYDFSSECWSELNDAGTSDRTGMLPTIDLDLWFEVDDENVHRVADFLPSLDWDREPVGLRLSFQPKDTNALLQNYSDALAKAAELVQDGSTDYRPWPVNLSDYLKKRLSAEYEIVYFVLTSKQTGESSNNDSVAIDAPRLLGNASSGAAKLIDSLICVDFLDAQRNLSDGESKGRHENLSRRLSRYYARNLAKQDVDLNALSMLTQSEEKLNAHFSEAFNPVLSSLTQLGYPGVGNYELVVKADFNPSSILNSNANVHYALPTTSAVVGMTATLPDRYNGLGFKNLIFMAVEILDFHHAWRESEANRPPVHLLMVEEPESHLHAQLQQVFIRQIMKLIPDEDEGFHTQMVVTTHSSHIIYEDSFKAIRYFRRATSPGGVHSSEVRNLSTFYEAEDKEVREFLAQYLKLTHCDLFFADGVILVEGNVERLLMPLMIAKGYPALQASHLTILEVGGAFAYKFDNLVAFLDVPTLVVTDLDSVHPPRDKHSDEEAEDEPLDLFTENDDEDDGGKSLARRSCTTTTVGALTSNETLKQWIPKRTKVEELLELPDDCKLVFDLTGNQSRVRIAFQSRVEVRWGSNTDQLAGRTLEEAFALENLEWCQDRDRTHLGLRIARADLLSLTELHEKIFKRVKNFDKTRFALGLITEDPAAWQTPAYIRTGLTWLENVIVPPIDSGTKSESRP